jgi:hypothetical protein
MTEYLMLILSVAIGVVVTLIFLFSSALLLSAAAL